MQRFRQGTTLFTALLWLICVVVVIQLWLEVALETLLSGQTTVLWPAALASLLLFGPNSGLLLFVLRLDRRLRGEGFERRESAE